MLKLLQIGIPIYETLHCYILLAYQLPGTNKFCHVAELNTISTFLPPCPNVPLSRIENDVRMMPVLLRHDDSYWAILQGLAQICPGLKYRTCVLLHWQRRRGHLLFLFFFALDVDLTDLTSQGELGFCHGSHGTQMVSPGCQEQKKG